jgi:muramoyltetrapeptide carboxypeptidase
MLDRRTMLCSGAACVAAAALAPAARAADRARKPPPLRAGDVVGLVEPAGYTADEAALADVLATIEGMGLVPRVGAHVGKRYGYLAGADEDRAADLNAMYADDEVRAVFAIRGGWGGARVLPLLDWRTIRANPKLLVGFSDVTALHLAFAARAGFPTIHAPNAANSWPETSWNSLWWLAFAGALPVLEGGGSTIRPGVARGLLLGGNLTVLSTLLGTPWMPDFTGAVLFLEDTGEAEYRIDRMLSQLALSGILGGAAGVVFGQCTRCTSGEPDYAGFTIPDLMRQYLEPLGVPAFTGANIGHVRGQISLPMGCEVEIDAGAHTIRVLESPTQ